jgi:hypothetical protein
LAFHGGELARDGGELLDMGTETGMSGFAKPCGLGGGL